MAASRCGWCADGFEIPANCSEPNDVIKAVVSQLRKLCSAVQKSEQKVSDELERLDDRRQQYDREIRRRLKLEGEVEHLQQSKIVADEELAEARRVGSVKTKTDAAFNKILKDAPESVYSLLKQHTPSKNNSGTDDISDKIQKLTQRSATIENQLQEAQNQLQRAISSKKSTVGPSAAQTDIRNWDHLQQTLSSMSEQGTTCTETINNLHGVFLKNLVATVSELLQLVEQNQAANASDPMLLFRLWHTADCLLTATTEDSDTNALQEELQWTTDIHSQWSEMTQADCKAYEDDFIESDDCDAASNQTLPPLTAIVHTDTCLIPCLIKLIEGSNDWGADQQTDIQRLRLLRVLSSITNNNGRYLPAVVLNDEDTQN